MSLCVPIRFERCLIGAALLGAGVSAGGCAALKNANDYMAEAREFESRKQYGEAATARANAAAKGFEEEDAAKDNDIQWSINLTAAERWDEALKACEPTQDARCRARVLFMKGDYAATKKELDPYARAFMSNYHPRTETSWEVGYRPEIYRWFYAAMKIAKSDPDKLMGGYVEDRYDPAKTTWKWLPGDKNKARPEYGSALETLFAEVLVMKKGRHEFRLPGVFRDMTKANPRVPPKFTLTTKYVLLRLWNESEDLDAKIKLLKLYLDQAQLMEEYTLQNPYIQKDLDAEGMDDASVRKLKTEVLLNPGIEYLLHQLKIELE